MNSHTFQSTLLQTFQERGYIYQISDPEVLDNYAKDNFIVAYIGFDCTAPSLHVGSLIQIMMLRTLQRLGHKPIILIGGGTTRVGDPSFRAKERPMLSVEDIEQNKSALKHVFNQFISFDESPTGALLLDNTEWLLPLGYIDFLREYGAHFSINRMLSFDSVKLRLEREQSLSFLEFNYMLLQAYDFLHLARHFQCQVQMGGSDQWGNIISGVELIRRKEGGKAFALTSPLLTTHKGEKMGKTAAGAIWLNADMLSPFDYWQYWRNSDDADVERFFYLFTELSSEEISTICQKKDINEVKKILATCVTTLLHGPLAAAQASEASERIFQEGGMDMTLPPAAFVTQNELKEGIGLLELCVRARLCQTLSQVRRHIRGGALRLNNKRVTEENYVVKLTDLQEKSYLKISLGKKHHVFIRLTEEEGENF